MVRDYLYVVDGALAYLRLVEAMAEDPEVVGEAFNFSTETPLTVLELAAALQRAAGTDLEPEIPATATPALAIQLLSPAKAPKVPCWAPPTPVAAARAAHGEWDPSDIPAP